MDWFNDFNVDVYSYSSYEDEYGFTRDGYVKKLNIYCDIQPVGIEKIKQVYGYDIEAQFELYCDEVLEESDIILWNNKTYKVEKIIPWNEYSIALLKCEVIDVGL